jgi:RNA polymerase sigma-70 factor, ECF subfamily
MNLEETFLKEYDQHADSIYRFCLFKLSDKEEARDVVQETFLKAWDYLARGGEIRNVKAFIFRIARNLVIDKYRKKNTESLDLLTENGFDPKFEEETEITDRLDAQNILPLLDQLSAEYKEIILLRYVEELTIGEMAETLGQSVGNISVKLFRAMAKLRVLYLTKYEEKNV